MSSLMISLGIDRLSHDERLQLVDEILDTLNGDHEPPPLTEAKRQELDRRLALLDANPSAVSTWEEVEARILQRCRGNSGGLSC
jgi:putative addiction module component (TIGR02574 family)